VVPKLEADESPPNYGLYNPEIPKALDLKIYIQYLRIKKCRSINIVSVLGQIWVLDLGVSNWRQASHEHIYH
jgi:hypothetical protein